jgi:aromatic ring-opening dioxygenase catalytic subunit (LigB family)
LLGEPGHRQLVDFLKTIPDRIEEPKAILVISAHWEEPEASLLSGAKPPLYYDYYGFPPEAYEIQYPAAGLPELAGRVQELLTQSGIAASSKAERGFDHGLFVPLKLMYPRADIPCIEVSLLADMNPAAHIAIGKAIAPLRRDGVLIIGSGASYHNMQAPRAGIDPGEEEIAQFDQWLVETCTAPELGPKDREQRLINWLEAPHARFCHPREEHLLPLHVCFGAAFEGAEVPPAELVFEAPMMGRTMLSFLW